MQIESLTEENKQLRMKLETALCKVEAVCLSDPFYITLFFFSFFLFFFLACSTMLLCLIVAKAVVQFASYWCTWLLCCEYKPEPSASYYHQIMHLCSLQG
jgi:hypothetical protein